MKIEDRKKLGASKRKEGKDFEVRVRADLKEKGWTVCRFDNDVKFNQTKEDIVTPLEYGGSSTIMAGSMVGELVQAKTSWRRTPHGMFPLNLNPGFPDFICHKFFDVWEVNKPEYKAGITHEVIAVESKISGVLDRPEKEKCQWYLDNQIFSRILIAEKVKIKNRIHIKYHDFDKKYGGKK